MAPEIFPNLFQAKNSKVTVIHEMLVEADSTGYVPLPEDEEELRPDLLNNQTLGLHQQNNEVEPDALKKDQQLVKLPDFVEHAGTLTSRCSTFFTPFVVSHSDS